MDLNTLPIHIPVGESIFNIWHTATYPEILEYKSIILTITAENFDKVVINLIEKKQDIGLILCIAAEIGNIELIKTIILNTNDLNIINQARTCASLNNNPESLNIVKYLTENYRLKFSQALLYNAANSNNLEVIEYLYIKYYAEMTNYSIIHSVLKTAYNKGFIDTIEILSDILKNTTQPDINYNSSLDKITNMPKWSGKESRKKLNEEAEYIANLKKINEQKKLDEEQKQIQETFHKALEKSKELKKNDFDEDIEDNSEDIEDIEDMSEENVESSLSDSSNSNK